MIIDFLSLLDESTTLNKLILAIIMMIGERAEGELSDAHPGVFVYICLILSGLICCSTDLKVQTPFRYVDQLLYFLYPDFFVLDSKMSETFPPENLSIGTAFLDDSEFDRSSSFPQ